MYKLNDMWLTMEIDSGIVVCNLKDGRTAILNEVEAYIFTNILKMELVDVISIAQERYNEENAKIQDDIVNFVGNLISERIILEGAPVRCK